MLHQFVGSRCSLLVTVPSTASAMERRVVREAGKRAGAAKVRLIEQTVAAAIGANLPVSEPIGTVIVSAGAGTTEVALISLGTMVGRSSTPLGGSDVDVAIKTLLRRKHGIVATDSEAEFVKLAVSTSDGAPTSSRVVEVRGTAISDGALVTVIVDVDELIRAFDQHADAVVDTTKATLMQAAPELAQDIIASGINMVGGAALSIGLAARLSGELSLPAYVTKEPAHTAIIGAGCCLDSTTGLEELFLAEH
jgi:rod shape-determining protein MreB